MLRLNSKKMLMLDNGKPFSMSLDCTDTYATLSCSFYVPLMVCGNVPNAIRSKYNKITFDVTIPSDNAAVHVCQDKTLSTVAENLLSGTHTISFAANGKRFDYFNVSCPRGGDNTITISNIILE